MKATLTCRDCGKPMRWQKTSLPQGLARCHPCRRTSPERKPTDQSHRMTLNCADCGRAMWSSTTSLPQGKARCLACRRARPAGPWIGCRGFCAWCAVWFEAGDPRARFCSRACASRAKAETERKSAGEERERKARNCERRRARLKGSPFVEDIDRLAVFERDHWTCGICGGPVPRDAVFPDVVSPSLDHIVPLNRGGEHSYRNVQLAHFGCNSGKCDRVA